MKNIDDTKIFFLHLKKCGGQTLRKRFYPYYKEANRNDPFQFIEGRRHLWNDNLNNYRVPLGEYDFKRTLFAKQFLYSHDEWNAMYKFTFVRNPFDRIVSSWLYLRPDAWRVLPRWGRAKLSFQSFLDWLPELWESKIDRHLATHTAPYLPDITGEDGASILMDYVGYFENLEQELVHVENEIGVNFKKTDARNVNHSKRHYREYYNKKARRKVETIFYSDLERLGYEF